MHAPLKKSYRNSLHLPGMMCWQGIISVSYTHLDVYKRQVIEGRELGQFVNDFTWYLRNLMLVQSSDDMEDVLDISTENLEMCIRDRDR